MQKRSISPARCFLWASTLSALFAVGCVHDMGEESEEGAFSSAQAKLVDFTFDGELLGTSSTNLGGQVRAQLLYTVGHLNSEPGVSQLAKLSLSSLSAASEGDGLFRIRYRAKLPVAWGDRGHPPSTYTFTLPSRIDAAAQDAFVAKYKAGCADEPAAANTSNFWYHYRPHARGCTFTPSDVVTKTAAVSVSGKNTSGKYPEYNRVWEDGVFRVVGVFGKYEEGATTDSDSGIAAYDAFVAMLQDELREGTVTPHFDGNPGAAVPEVTIAFARPDGRRVEATVLLVDKLATVGAAFDKRYAELTPGADLVVYAGHAGLGANVAALARKGKFFPGKYQIFFINGCDTFAYADETMAKTRALLNPDDPSGTRYMDVVTNAMPAFFSSMPLGAMAFVRAMLAPTEPRTYESIFNGIDSEQVVVVTGEEDNAFAAGAPVSSPWSFAQAGAVGKRETLSYETGVLPAGKYVFSLLPDPAIAGGDADLRVRVGAQPTITKEFKCPSYVANSNERCTLTLSSPANVFIAVTGDTATMKSPFELRAFQR